MLVREAMLDDAGGLAETHVESWRAAYAELIPRAFLDQLSVAHSTKRWAERLSGPGAPMLPTIVAVEHERVVGFVVGGPDDEEPVAGRIFAIYTRPEVWGTGAGYALMNVGLDALRGRGFPEAILWVLEGNLRARRFYERAGWFADDGRQDEEFGGVLVPEVRYRRHL